jgi:hypothetical protein
LRDDSPTELHTSQTEILVVQAGEGTLVLGGIVPELEEGKHGETRESFHDNLREMHLTRGDIVHYHRIFGYPHEIIIDAHKTARFSSGLIF